MIRFHRRLVRILLVLAVICLPERPLPAAQIPAESEDVRQDEMQLIGRIEALQSQLESGQVSEREQAVNELLKLGPIVLDHLEDPTEQTTSDARQRVANLRSQLETMLVKDFAKPSLIRVENGWTIDRAISEIASQSKNKVGLSPNLTDDIREKTLELPAEKIEFWSLLNSISAQGKLQVERYAGNGDALVLNHRLPDETPQTLPPSDHQGIFRFLVTRIDATRNLVSPAHNEVNISVDIRWEPRVRPISIRIPAKSIRIVDEFDKPVTVVHPNAVFGLSVQPEISFLDIVIPVELVDRQVETLKSLTATAEAILPGRTETFRFRNIGRVKPGAQQQKAGAVVTFEGVEENEDLYGLTVSLAFEEEFRALESHQSWVFDNPLWLEDENGSRTNPIAMETIRQDNSGVAINFLFADKPTAETLVYQTPAAIVKSTVEITLENIPLP